MNDVFLNYFISTIILWVARSRCIRRSNSINKSQIKQYCESGILQIRIDLWGDRIVLTSFLSARFCVVVTFFFLEAAAAVAAAAALDFCIKLQYKTLNRYIVNEFFICQPQHFHSTDSILFSIVSFLFFFRLVLATIWNIFYCFRVGKTISNQLNG